MQPDHVNRRRQAGSEAKQFGCRRQIRRQIQQHHVRLELPHPDFQRLLGRISLEIGQDLERPSLRKRRQKLLRQVAVRRDQQCRQFRFVLAPCNHVSFDFRSLHPTRALPYFFDFCVGGGCGTSFGSSLTRKSRGI